MRIRQVRPEFFTDPVMASLPPDVRLTYIGLWIVADDAGWLRWDAARIGAVLYPFETVRRRERHLEAARQRLVEAGRLVNYDCGCAEIPTLSRHQRVTGKQTFGSREAHGKHRTLTDKHPIAPELGTRNGTELGTELVEGAQARNDEPSSFHAAMVANGIDPRIGRGKH